MTTRFKLIAAALGLIVAASAIGGASAKTIVKTVKTHGPARVHVTKVITHRPHRVLLGIPSVRHVRLVRPAPVLVRKAVRVTNRPLWHRPLLAHRVVTKTIIR